MPSDYEAIFHGQTSSTQVLAEKAIWLANLSPEVDEDPDKIAKFAAACIRLASVAKEMDLLIPDGLNRHHYEVLQKDSATAQIIAAESGTQWQVKKQKDLKNVKNLKTTFSWDAFFENIDKQALVAFLEQYYEKSYEFRLCVDIAVSHKIYFINEMALQKKIPTSLVPIEVMSQKFKIYVLEECAGLLAIRLKGYEHAFYLAKLNLASAMIATTIFPLEAEEINNEMLRKINNTVLTFHTPSQYKQIHNTPQQASTVQSHKLKEQSTLQNSSSMVDGYRWPHVDARIALGAFFDSPTIPVQIKIDVLFKIISTNNNVPKATTIPERIGTTAPIISGELGFTMTPAASTHTQSITKIQNNSDMNNNNNITSTMNLS